MSRVIFQCTVIHSLWNNPDETTQYLHDIKVIKYLTVLSGLRSIRRFYGKRFTNKQDCGEIV
jgi:hypothetical protein